MLRCNLIASILASGVGRPVPRHLGALGSQLSSVHPSNLDFLLRGAVLTRAAHATAVVDDVAAGFCS